MADDVYQTLVESIVDYAIYMLDRSGRITSWNAGAQRIKGYRADEIVGNHFSAFYTGEDQREGLPEKALHIAATEGRYESDGWRVRKDGTRFWAHATIDPIRDPNGEVIGFAKITRDITDKKQSESALASAQQALFQAQKLEALGQLTGGVAHDFNNLLMALVASLDLLRKRLPRDDDRSLQLLQNLTKGAERGALLVQRMLAFARRQDLKIAPIDVAVLIEDMRALLERSLGPKGSLVLDLPAGLPPAHTDANQLEAALLNLVVNARDAMPQDGVVTISAGRADGPVPNADLPPGRFIRISVSDQGTGMDERTRARAIEPFFTTKGVGKGTGLGLSMVQGLAEQSGGKLGITSAPGEGTTIDLYLPTNGAVPDPDVRGRDLVERPGTPDQDAGTIAQLGLVVLIVDDDELVLTATAALLDDMGYQVIEASSGSQALEIIARTPVDLLLTDQVMPEITGLQLAVAVHAVRPEVPIVLASGFADIGIAVPDYVYRMTKPYSRRELGQALGNLLAVQAD